MPDFKLCTRKNRVNKKGNTAIYIRVTHKGKTRYIDSGMEVPPHNFNPTDLVTGVYNCTQQNIKLRNMLNSMNEEVLKIGPLRIKSLSMESLLQKLRIVDGDTPPADFYAYTRQYIERLEQENRRSYAVTFAHTLKVLTDYTRTDILFFTDITPHFLTDLARKMKLSRLSDTTISMTMRNIRTLFNMAITDPRQPIQLNDYPFRQYKIPKGSGRRLSMAAADIKALTQYTPANHAERLAVDMFLLSFYLIGINFKDLLMLKPADYFRGRIIYDRSKTGKPYSILVQPEAGVIIQRYAGKKYLLTVMEAKEKAQKKERKNPLYKDITDQANRTFKTMHLSGKLPQRISTYHARHTWATIARNIGIPKDDIITALGHGTATVTDMYIEVDYRRIDEANRRVIDSIK